MWVQSLSAAAYLPGTLGMGLSFLIPGGNETGTFRRRRLSLSGCSGFHGWTSVAPGSAGAQMAWMGLLPVVTVVLLSLLFFRALVLTL